MGTHVLTDDEKRRFQRDGYLILRGAVEKSLMQRTEDQLWSAVDVDRKDPKAWTKQTNIRLERPDEEHNGAMLEVSRHPNVWGVAEQMVGSGIMRPPDGVDVLINWPRPEAEWRPLTRGHLDGYNVQHRYNPFTVGVTVYGRPVRQHGGAFTYWPGSHRKAWGYFRDHPWLDEEGRDVRFGLIMRFSRTDVREVINDKPASMWKYWEGMPTERTQR